MKEYNMTINGNEYAVSVEITNDNTADVVVNGATYHVELADSKVKKAVASKPQVVAVPASHPVTNAATPAAGIGKPSAATGDGSERTIQSPLPGVILDIKVAVGDTVAAGQTLIVLEAMKMENNIDANFAGVIKSIKVKCSDSVLEGDVLITIG